MIDIECFSTGSRLNKVPSTVYWGHLPHCPVNTGQRDHRTVIMSTCFPPVIWHWQEYFKTSVFFHLKLCGHYFQREDDHAGSDKSDDVELIKSSHDRQTLVRLLKWAIFIECRPVNQKVAGLIPSQGTRLGCRPGPQLGGVWSLIHLCVSPSLSPSLPL